METEINGWAVLVCGVVAMALGFVWYGPLFGKKWLELIGSNKWHTYSFLDLACIYSADTRE